MEILGRLVDVINRKIINAGVIIEEGRIEKIYESRQVNNKYILPGFIDAHIHIESSMVTPAAFAIECVRHGTVAVVSDPHEIANVCGVDGINFMINDAKKVPVHFFFGAPSCVPATDYETSGARLGVRETEELLERNDIYYLSEMMNYPGVIYKDEDVLEKINMAKKRNKPVDGHAPGLSGKDLENYVNAGISTDHECSSYAEAEEKISLGMKILIREGSAARNLDNLKDLYNKYPGMLMLCSDDLHPEMLAKGHINLLVKRLVAGGYDLFDVLGSATLNPVTHYNLPVGLLREGDPADFIVTDNVKEFNVLETWINGKKVYQNGDVLFTALKGETVNNFNSGFINEAMISVPKSGDRIRVIKAIEGALLTKEVYFSSGNNITVEPDVSKDLLKIVVKDRYHDGVPRVGFITGFGLKDGAFASSVAHDSHNIICIGTKDEDIVNAVNEVISMKGGLAVSVNGRTESLKLEIAGIMTSKSCRETSGKYQELNDMMRDLGCLMKAPFMSLAFMALLVIPELKIGDKGLFDVKTFRPVSLFC